LGAGLIASCGARTGLFVGVGIGGEEPCTHPIPLEKAVPNLYFILDRSRSMMENNKWDTVRTVIGDLMTSLGPNASYGAATFPSPTSANLCAPGTEILTPGDTTGAAAAALLTATTISPNGGTPTAATLTSLTPELTSLKGSTFAILATDGGANCNPNLSCTLDTCTANLDAVVPMCQPFVPPNCCTPMGPGGPSDCLDTQATVDAVTKLRQGGVPVYVVGILGSAPYESMLDQLAQAGGTARAAAPFYYRVDTADAQALAAVLAQIAAKITASCTVKLAGPPNDPTTVVVSLGGQPIPEDPTNGWQITGTTLTLSGSSCQELLTGQALGLAVSDGCPPM
jgi:Mg-chelatase subunit ChlD